MEEGSMSRKTLKTIATLAGVLATAAVLPATGAAHTDALSPAVGDAPRVVVVNHGNDLRSPDATDAARGAVANKGQDLRSPDGRDAARPSSTPVPSATPDNGTDWGEIGIITGAVVLALGGAGALFYVSRRRGQLRKPGATVASS
jgi:hypothetical protein